MKLERTDLRLWGSIAGLVCLVVLAVGGLRWVQSDLQRSVNELNAKSEQALTTAVELHRRCVRGQERKRVADLKTDLESRLRDLESPAMVVAGLSETCRRFGVRVMEIAPVGHDEAGAAPSAKRRYRLVLGGTYRQIGELLEGCATQRLPARVTEFSVAPPPTDGDGHLAAEMVVECFALKTGKPAGSKT